MAEPRDVKIDGERSRFTDLHGSIEIAKMSRSNCVSIQINRSRSRGSEQEARSSRHHIGESEVEKYKACLIDDYWRVCWRAYHWAGFRASPARLRAQFMRRHRDGTV